MEFTHIKCPINHNTFKVNKIKKWVVDSCVGLTLNLFAGTTILNPDVQEIRVDKDAAKPADYHMDALEFLLYWDKTETRKFDTVILDPPYSYRKSMEYYNGMVASPFRQVKDKLLDIITPAATIITLGYHSVSMGRGRGFSVKKLALFSHGGATHDTIGTVEIRNLK